MMCGHVTRAQHSTVCVTHLAVHTPFSHPPPLPLPLPLRAAPYSAYACRAAPACRMQALRQCWLGHPTFGSWMCQVSATACMHPVGICGQYNWPGLSR